MVDPLPPYVERPTGYDLALAGPYSQRGVSLRGYAFRADTDALHRTCDRYLNGPAKLCGHPYEYVPLVPLSLLTLLDMKRVSAADPALGYMHEIDGAFAFPVWRRLRAHPLDPLGWGVASFMPYLWVNSDFPMITGREVIGFRKEVATSFTRGDGMPTAGAADLSHVDAWVVPNRGEELAVRRIVDVDPASLQSAPGDHWSTPHDMLSDLLGRVEGFAAHEVLKLLEILKIADALTIPVAFLKQFRDAYDPSKACYQAVFEANGSIPFAGFGGGLLPGAHAVTVQSYASHPVADELGLAPGGRLDALFAFEARFDFDFELPT